jgi:hypothetical protein
MRGFKQRACQPLELTINALIIKDKKFTIGPDCAPAADRRQGFVRKSDTRPGRRTAF